MESTVVGGSRCAFRAVLLAALGGPSAPGDHSRSVNSRRALGRGGRVELGARCGGGTAGLRSVSDTAPCGPFLARLRRGVGEVPVRAVRKPNSVPSLGCPQKGDDHLSSHDDCSPRSSDLPGSFGRAILERFPIWSCSVRGLPCLGCHHPSGALLPHHFTLTSPFPERRYIFCGTFLPVTGTGSYPAHCPGEFGLSSDLRPAIIWSTRTGKTIIR